MTKIAARPPGAARRAPYKPSSFLKCLNAAAKIRCSSFFAISGANFLVLETPVRIELMPRIIGPRLSHESAAAVSDNMATASRHLVDEQEDLDPFLDNGGRRKSKPELGEHVFSERDLLVVLPDARPVRSAAAIAERVAACWCTSPTVRGRSGTSFPSHGDRSARNRLVEDCVSCADVASPFRSDASGDHRFIRSGDARYHGRSNKGLDT